MSSKVRRKTARLTRPGKKAGAAVSQSEPSYSPAGETSKDEVLISSDYWFKVAAKWTDQEWSTWLMRGMLNWHYPPPHQIKNGAFDYLGFNPEDDVVAQLESELNQRRPLVLGFTRGLRLALEEWAPQFTVPVLQDLLHLTQKFPTRHTPNSEHFAQLMGRTMVLESVNALEAETDRQEAVSQIVVAVSQAEWTGESERLLDQLRIRHLWHPSFIGHVLSARVRADHGAWLRHLRDAFDEIELGYSKRDRACLIESIVVIVGLEVIISTLNHIVATTETKAFLREIISLFLVDDPVIEVPDRNQQFVFESKRYPEDEIGLVEGRTRSGQELYNLVTCLRYMQRCAKHEDHRWVGNNVRDLTEQGSGQFGFGPAEVKPLLRRLSA
jgi:hypothetical protein